MPARLPADSSDGLQRITGRYCSSCHGKDEAAGGLRFDQLDAPEDSHEAYSAWVRIYDRVDRGQMPPQGSSQPGPEERGEFVRNLGSQLKRVDATTRRRVVRRLNRDEYENSVCDLFQIRVGVKEYLPADGVSGGFDTIGSSLNIASEHIEAYMQAADYIVQQIQGPDRAPVPAAVKLQMADEPLVSNVIGKDFIKTDDGSVVKFWSGITALDLRSARANAPGTYRLKAQVKTFQSKRPLVLAVYGGQYNGKGAYHLISYVDIPANDDWVSIEFEDYLVQGGHFRLDPYRLLRPKLAQDKFNGPGLMVGQVSVEGPLDEWPPRSRKVLLEDIDPKTAKLSDIDAILNRILPILFRRQVAQNKIAGYSDLAKREFDAKRPFLECVGVALKAALCSPDFLFLGDRESGETVSNVYLASRLSYFLWSSCPDSELMQYAIAHRMEDSAGFRFQADRLLQDEKVNRFIDRFTGQWLRLRDIDATEPDGTLYPEYDEMLRYAMIEEARRSFKEILQQDLPVHDFIDPNWAILNERLAIHYGVRDVIGQEYRRVDLPPDSVRGGVLTQAGVLKTLANGTTTSPVVRGTWVLDNIVGDPSPRPPANVPAIEPDLRGGGTVVELLEKHRRDESCAVCHRKIDPLGIALENFDPIGGWRRNYRTLTVGEVPLLEINGARVRFRIGRSVNASRIKGRDEVPVSVRDLKKQLVKDKKLFARCLTEKLLEYALGRQLGFSDRDAVNSIVEKSAQNGYGFRSLLLEIVQSPIFKEP